MDFFFSTLIPLVDSLGGELGFCISLGGVFKYPIEWWARKHRRGWEGAALESDAGCGHRHHCPCIGAASEIFFFFSDSSQLGSDSRRLNSDSCRLGSNSRQLSFDSSWFDQNWVVSTKSDRVSRWPKLAEIIMPEQPKSALNEAQTSWICLSSILFWIFVASFVFSFLFCVSCNLLSLFCEPRPL